MSNDVKNHKKLQIIILHFTFIWLYEKSIRIVLKAISDTFSIFEILWKDALILGEKT